jgi:glutamate/aspartate transport system substrate-binding protein
VTILRRGRIALLAFCLATGARAEEGTVLTGTLQAIQQRGAVRVGYRESAPPFAFLNKAGQPVGFSLDLCRGIAADIASALSRDLLEPGAADWEQGIRMALVPVAADARLPKLLSGEIDLECGSTTATEQRARTVAFSPVFFLAGTKLMVPGGSPVASTRDLAGKTVVAGAGTTNADVLRRLSTQTVPPFTVAEAPDLAAAYAMLAAGRADAFASDDILLSGLIATQPDGQRFRIVGDYLSYEPYAIALRRDDPAFGGLVRQSFERMAREGALTALYNRWLTQPLPTGAALNLPMSAHLAEMYRALGSPD